MRRLFFAAVLIGAPGLAETTVEIDPPAEGSASAGHGLDAWARIDRCASQLQSHVNDVLTWGVAGMPCPQD
ncbi:hypothetical protein [Halovulum sp. GXIMD14793]